MRIKTGFITVYLGNSFGSFFPKTNVFENSFENINSVKWFRSLYWLSANINKFIRVIRKINFSNRYYINIKFLRGS